VYAITGAGREALAQWLAGAFFTEFQAMVARGAGWAHEQVERWPADPADAVADLADLAEIANRAGWASPGAASGSATSTPPPGMGG